MLVQVQKEREQMAFQVASLPDASDDPLLTTRVPYNSTANKPKQMTNVTALQLSVSSPIINLPHPSSTLKYFQREMGTAQHSEGLRVCNLTLVWKSAPAFFRAIDQEARLASQWGSISMKPGK